MSIPRIEKECPKCKKIGFVCYEGLKNMGGWFEKKYSCCAIVEEGTCKNEWTEQCTPLEKEAFTQ